MPVLQSLCRAQESADEIDATAGKKQKQPWISSTPLRMLLTTGTVPLGNSGCRQCEACQGDETHHGFRSPECFERHASSPPIGSVETPRKNVDQLALRFAAVNCNGTGARPVIDASVARLFPRLAMPCADSPESLLEQPRLRRLREFAGNMLRRAQGGSTC